MLCQAPRLTVRDQQSPMMMRPWSQDGSQGKEAGQDGSKRVDGVVIASERSFVVVEAFALSLHPRARKFPSCSELDHIRSCIELDHIRHEIHHSGLQTALCSRSIMKEASFSEAPAARLLLERGSFACGQAMTALFSLPGCL